MDGLLVREREEIKKNISGLGGNGSKQLQIGGTNHTENGAVFPSVRDDAPCPPYRVSNVVAFCFFFFLTLSPSSLLLLSLFFSFIDIFHTCKYLTPQFQCLSF